MKKLMNSILIEHKKTVYDLKKMKEVEVVDRIVEISTLTGLVNHIIKTENITNIFYSKDKLNEVCYNIERFFENDIRDLYELDIEIGNEYYQEIIELIREELE